MQALLEQVPTMYATARLRRHRHVASQKEISSNDIYDLIALPAAIVHCDVVVTERQYAAVRALRLDECFDTVVLHKLDELLAHLLSWAPSRKRSSGGWQERALRAGELCGAPAQRTGAPRTRTAKSTAGPFPDRTRRPHAPIPEK
jgi:hypothetical protein